MNGIRNCVFIGHKININNRWTEHWTHYQYGNKRHQSFPLYLFIICILNSTPSNEVSYVRRRPTDNGFWSLLSSLSSIALIHGSENPNENVKSLSCSPRPRTLHFAYLISWSHVTKPNWKHFYANGMSTKEDINFRYKVREEKQL